MSRYETLRAFGLGEPTSPGERAGLVVLLRRGLWAWARGVTNELELDSTAPPASFSHQHAVEDRTLVPLLAAMASNVNERRVS